MPTPSFFLFGVEPIAWTIAQTAPRQAVMLARMLARMLGRVLAVVMMATYGVRPLGAGITGSAPDVAAGCGRDLNYCLRKSARRKINLDA